MEQQTKTLKLRVKDKHSKTLEAMACDVNMVWNFCNETSYKAIASFTRKPKFLSGYDLCYLTAGLSKEDAVSIPASSVQSVCIEYATRRKQYKKSRLNWRVSNPKSSKKSLGWVPFRFEAIKLVGQQIQFRGELFSFWDSYGLSKFSLRSGSFNQDSRGRWYLNIAVKVEVSVSEASASIGVDLGMKETAVTSDGQRLEGRVYRRYERALGSAQRACKKDRVKAIHAKIKNTRKDLLHKFSTKLVKENAAIFVGNISSKSFVKTKMAKSTLDAGWAMFKTMLDTKSHQAGIVFEVVEEAYSTQSCSSCGVISNNSPKGRAGLRVREWTCSNCGTVHDRDINAAKNILAVGHDRLAVGSLAHAGTNGCQNSVALEY